MREYSLGQIKLFYKAGAKLRSQEAAMNLELSAIAAQGSGKQISDVTRRLRGNGNDFD